MKERYQRILAGLNPFQHAWMALDFKLTRHPEGLHDDQKMEDILSQIHQQAASLEELIGESMGTNPLRYLSDGGYSRIVWPTESKTLFLTGNSSKRAFDAWDSALPEREALETLLRQEYQTMEGLSEAQRMVERHLF